MKPGSAYFGYQTFDLTEGKLHRYEIDGVMRTVMMFPKAWEKVGETQTMPAVNGGVHHLQAYRVTDWDVVEIQGSPL